MKRRFVFGILLAAVLMLTAVPLFAGTQESAPVTGIGVGVGMLAFGLVVNEQVLSAMKRNFQTIFNQARSAYQAQWMDGAMDIPSTTALNTYAWLSEMPKMREWIGERHWKALKAQAYNITNKTFESSVRIPREAIEDDQYGLYGFRFTSMGHAAEQIWDDLFFDVLNKGFTTTLSYDGKAFFATNHESGGNKASGGESALSATSYKTAIAALKSVKDSNGDPLLSGGEAIKLWVPPALEETGRLLLNADYVSVAGGSTQTNVWKNSATLKVSPKLTSATAWFLTVEFMGMKPFIVQKRRLPGFVAQENPGDPSVFNRNEYAYGTDARGNAGPGLHQLAYGSVGA